jgi:5-hydroxyisourate hydrolase-like protein (transthyretin family)
MNTIPLPFWRRISSSHLLLAGILIALGLVSASSAPYVSAQDDGRVRGTVVNGTTGEPAAGIDVTLSRFEQIGPDSVDVTTTTDSEGRFSFEGLSTDRGYVYAASTRYQRVLYSTGMILISQSSEQEVELRIHETTTNDTVITMQARGIVISNADADEGVLTVTDLSVVANNSSRTYIGDEDGRTLRLHVPGNAIQVTPRPGFDFTNAMIENATLFATSPLRPGPINATVDYTVPYTGSVARFPIQSSYPTDVVRILVPTSDDLGDITVDATGALLSDRGNIEIEGRRYHVWTVNGLSPGQTLNVSISGLPPTVVIHNELRTGAPALIAFSVLLMASGVTGVIVMRRGLHRQRPVLLSAPVAAPLDERRAELSENLRDLEARWNAGDVEESQYRLARRMILEDLRKISRQYRGLGDDE